MTRDLLLRIQNRIDCVCDDRLPDWEIKELANDIAEMVDADVGAAIMDSMQLGDIFNAVGLEIRSKSHD